MTNTTRHEFLRASAATAALAGLTTSMREVFAEAWEVSANNATAIKDESTTYTI